MSRCEALSSKQSNGSHELLENDSQESVSPLLRKRRKVRDTGTSRWQNDIPEHLLVRIFEILFAETGSKELLKKAASICKRWNKIAEIVYYEDTATSKFKGNELRAEESRTDTTCLAKNINESDTDDEEIESYQIKTNIGIKIPSNHDNNH